ncbi:WXG100-like domain-containing protein [Rhizomonospora bruguierae]|uniref:WXG100-like domain-containing protein n=1 Tax=Rhizomonospora bruguierae TaxID=1581705 RepID=UPI001BCDEEC2|nr:hypothetical protein [Micromonospora sp. NBRC 107566]
MTAAERVQISQVLHRLDETLAALNPASVVYRLENAIHAVADPPPGEPGRLRDLAAAYRDAARDLAPIAAEVRAVAKAGGLPAVWSGPAGGRAAQVVTATADLVDRAPAAFTLVAGALEEYAESVERLRARHADLRQALFDAWHEASRVVLLGVTVRMVDPTRLAGLVRRATDLVTGCRAVYRESLTAAERLEGRLADARGRARTDAARRAGRPVAEAVLLANAATGPTSGGDNAILPLAQVERAARLRAALSPADRATLDGVLAAATDPVEEAYLLKAFAAGHTVAEVVTFAAQIAGRGREWLRTHLSLVDPGRVGPVRFKGTPVRQYDAYTCGSTSVLLARAMTDPLYALRLTTGGEPDDDAQTGADAFDRRLAAEEQRIHDGTNLIWPQRLGTTPWGVAGALTEGGDGYRWRLVDDGDPRSVDPALRDAVTAVDAGRPVPILLGDVAPTHYVLLVGHEEGDLLVYEPSGGEVVRVPEDDFRAGRMRALGPAHVQAVVTPGG